MEKMNVPVQCAFCGKYKMIPMTLDQWNLYCSQDRPHIQDIFPELSADDRELLISYTCPECWDKMFSDIGEW